MDEPDGEQQRMAWSIVQWLSSAIVWLLHLATIRLPRTIFATVHWGTVVTLEFDFAKLVMLIFLSLTLLSFYVKYKYLNRYTKLREAPLTRDDGFDLHPDVATEQAESGFKNYLDEFLSAIRIFGFLEKPVFHELARHLQTRRLVAGDTLSLDSDKSFYIVIDGVMQVYAQTDPSARYRAHDAYDDEDDNGFQLLNEVENGGTLSSLFTILSLFTEDVQLRYEEDDMLSPGNGIPPPSNRRSKSTSRDADVSSLRLDESPGSSRHHRRSSSAHRRASRLRSSSQASESSAIADESDTADDDDDNEGPGSGRPPRSGVTIKDIPPSPLLDQPTLPDTPGIRTPPRESTIARAKVDTTLAVIPADAFKKLTKRFPNASAHIVQVILTRLQRVTFLTSHKYLGLTSEVVRTEKAINALACYPLPRAFYESGGLQHLRQRFLPDTEDIDLGQPEQQLDYFALGLPTPSAGPRMDYMLGSPPGEQPSEGVKLTYRKPSFPSSGGLSYSRVKKAGDILSMANITDEPESFTTNENGPLPSRHRRTSSSSTKMPPPQASRSFSFNLGAAQEFDLRKAVMDSISKSIGLVQSSASVAPSVEASPMVGPHEAPFQRAVFNSSFGSLGMLGQHGRDDESTMTASSYSTPNLPDLENEVEILFFPQDSTLVKAGDKNAGLYYVIDGILDVSMPAESDEMAAHSPGLNFSSTPRSTGEAMLKSEEKLRTLFTVKPGGIAGYLSSLSGFPSYVDIKAKTDAYVGFLPVKALERIMDRRPIVLLTLAKRLSGLLSPLVLHIDSALEWMQVDAGQVIYRQHDRSDSFFIVIQGRLRSIAEKAAGGVEILGEYGQGESVGEIDCITGSRRPSTLHAIRDTELARMPMTLFNAISVRHPSTTIKITRTIAARVRREVDEKSRSIKSPGLGKNNLNLKTVAIIPVTQHVPVTEFAAKLRAALGDIGAPTSYLNQATITAAMGRHAFSRMGKLKLAGWLADTEQRYRIVMYVADTVVSSPWTQTCIRQADCILLIANGASDPSIGEYERLLIGMKTTARKELIILHPERSVLPGSTRPWLKARPWIHAHHHIEMHGLPIAPSGPGHDAKPVLALRNFKARVQHRFEKYRGRDDRNAPTRMASLNDFGRLARRLCGRSVGVVLGGGGARGISHLGVLKALLERDIPIDAIGGTSIGSLIGGLYARNGDLVSTFGRTKRFSGRMSTLWRILTDVTYPLVAYTTGHEFNRGVYKELLDYHIEDLWINFFCNTTNITHSRMDVHTTGYAWRYIRASMSLAGLLPPLCDEGNMLVDGGYCDNLPVSVMLSMGVDKVFASDVGSIDDTSPRNFGESVSGWWVLLNRWNPWSATRDIPSITEIQSRLTYVSSVKTLEEAKTTPGVFYMRMPVEGYGTMQFGRFNEIYQAGSVAAEAMLHKWAQQGRLPNGLEASPTTKAETARRGRGLRRNSV
ncbi:uncharacterized protein L969DRAFT_100884 [Mixia osmundae IAM 14324]|uniref:Lysophospholipase NTE1 n=1 Tax=Mixia osmundae (strain CBS 9802 / IAM 14324 / JCM 22182 / KY 12970) TaxID=764103 RepID=G7E848_MIXOS|nr:uncharacterized protein L969DRAFT_100884 [Mixia osmundae IAM 14324]KEI42400.1 hypothetical protein L969DRAFT_100884 [Mixia osmundae IAM 14324]GAA99008.1 hypothetical protein E5Q_05697 [Mixia osmundae IAM 14324]